ncbi:MAG: UbiD family decarboxylase [Candidatus Thorarchaeota archaeon]|nr:UbiD family decarboxylase [Candidatus Thorarchaeota archaeon]
MSTSFRDAIKLMKDCRKLKEIDEQFSPKYEIAKLASLYTSPLLFSHLRGYEKFQAIAGLYTPHNIKMIFGLRDKKQLLKKILTARGLKMKQEQRIVTKAPVQEKVVKSTQVNLKKLPIPTFYPKDMGPYITSGIVLSKDPQYGVNASYHRMSPISSNKLVARVVKRDLWAYLQRARRRGKKLEATVVIGTNVGLAIAAAMSPPIDESELELASALGGEIELTQAKTVNLHVPARAEIVLEGEFLPDEGAQEGPFVDISGTYDKIREQPIFRVNCITHRRDPIFHIIVPAGLEHKTLMGLPKEAEILKAVSEVSMVKAVNLTRSGCGWLDAVISIEKKQDDEATNAGMAAITGHPSLKRIIVVDPDIDVTNMDEVQWAVITRAHPAEDYLIVPKAKGSSLDHTGEQKGKIIIDATIKGTPEEFKKQDIPATKRVNEFIKESNHDEEN